MSDEKLTNKELAEKLGKLQPVSDFTASGEAQVVQTVYPSQELVQRMQNVLYGGEPTDPKGLGWKEL